MRKKHQSLMLALLAAHVAVGGTALAADATHTFDLGTFVVDKGEAATYDGEPLNAVTYGGGTIARTTSVGVLGEKQLIDTPFNVTGYTEKIIEDRQAQTVEDVVLYDPSVSSATDMPGNKTWTIRGLNQSAEDTSFNGMFGAGPIYGDSVDNVASVEVLKGPAALLNGMSPNGSVAGSINLVPKRAEDTPTRQFTVGVDNGHQWRQHIDLGQRFGDNNKYGVRINASHKSGSGKLNNEHINNNNIAVGLDVKGSNYRASLDAGYTNAKNEDFSTALRVGSNYVPAAFKANSKFSTNGAFIHNIEKYIAVKGEYDISRDWTVYSGFGFRTSAHENLTNTLTFNNYSATGGAVNTASTARTSHANSQTLGVKGKVVTGRLTHAINVGFTRYSSEAAALSGTSHRYSVNAVDPAWLPYTGQLLEASNLTRTSRTLMSGLSITDAISTNDEKWQFILGARYQKIASQNFNRTTGVETSSYNSNAWTPAFGIVHKFTPNLAVYGNYIQGLQPGVTVPYNDGNLNEGEVFAPYKTAQREFGFKYDIGKFAATTSFFTIDLPTYGYSRLNPRINGYGWRYEQRGITRNRGIEMNLYGEPTQGTRILAGFMLLDARIKDSATASLVGKRTVGRSKLSATVGVDQDIKSVPGLSMNVRATYNSHAFISDDNTVRVSPWIRWDLGAKYEFKAGNKPMTLRADVYNVLNHSHWEAQGYRVKLAKERTLALSLTTNF